MRSHWTSQSSWPFFAGTEGDHCWVLVVFILHPKLSYKMRAHYATWPFCFNSECPCDKTTQESTTEFILRQ